MNERSRYLYKASWFGIIGNIILAVLKISAGLISGSMAVLADGIDSTTDVLSFIISLIAAKFVNKPPDIKYPYGYNRAETIAAKTVSFIIFFAGAQLFYSTIIRIINNTELNIPSMLAIYVTIFSIIGKAFLAFYQFRIGKKVDSKMLIANGKNMFTDILLSSSVLVGLVFVKIFQLPLIDMIFALGISFLIMKTAFEIFMQTNKELMDGVDDTTIYCKLFDAVESVEGAYNPHRVRLRKHANMFVVSLDIEVNESITIAEGHKIAKAVEDKIKDNIDNIYDIMIHTEPLGNVEDEQFGLSRKIVRMDDEKNKNK